MQYNKVVITGCDLTYLFLRSNIQSMNFYQAYLPAQYQKIKILKLFLFQFRKNYQNMNFYQAYRFAKYKKSKTFRLPVCQFYTSQNWNFYQAYDLHNLKKPKMLRLCQFRKNFSKTTKI